MELIRRGVSGKESIGRNTTIGVVATNAMLSKAAANKVASMAHNGLSRTIRPVHTMYDGDTIFCMATGKVESDISIVGTLAADIMSKAVVRAVERAETLYERICCRDLRGPS